MLLYAQKHKVIYLSRYVDINIIWGYLESVDKGIEQTLSFTPEQTERLVYSNSPNKRLILSNLSFHTDTRTEGALLNINDGFHSFSL